MSRLGISTGTTPNDGTGDSLLLGASKINKNFDELYNLLGDGTTLSGIVTSLTAGDNISLSGSTGNVTITGQSSGANVTISDNPPSSPNSGDLWWESDAGRLKVYYSNVWVDSNPAGGNSGGGGGGISGINIQDEGSTLSTTATALNFVGSGVVASGTGSTKTITISGGSGVGNTNNIRTNFLEVSGISTFNGGVDITGNIDSTNLETGTGSLTLGNSSSQFDIRFSPSAGSSPAIRYNISEGISIYNRYNGGADLLADVTFGASQTFVKHITPFSDSTYNLGTNGVRWATIHSDNIVTGNVSATQFVGAGATINSTGMTVTGISTFNGAVDVNANVEFNGDVDVNANVEFKASSGNSSLYMYDENAINLGSNNDARIVYNNTGNIVKFERVGSAGEIEIDAAPVTLKHSDSVRLQTTNYGISVDQSIAGYAYLQAPFWKQPNGSTVTINVTVATKTQEHRYNGSGSGNGYLLNGVQAPFLTLTPGRSYRFFNTNTGSHPLKFYLEADRTTLYSTGVTFDNAYTEIAISDTTPQVLHYQCTNHAYMGNAVYTNSNKLQTPYTVSVGSGSSTNGIDSPALTLSHNNSTVVGTAGTTGQVKQIGGQPYYYDGTTWRALFLSEAPLTVNQADSDWDNTMIRMNFDQANIGAVTNLKDGRTPAATNVDLVASPLKYGTKSARFQSGNTGLSFTQNNSGSVYYPFEGAWTLEGWFYFDSSALPNETVITNSHALFSNLHTTTGVQYNWRIGFYHGGSTLYNFYWSNKNSSATGNNGAGNSNTGFLLDQRGSNTFANNAWHHIAIVREPGNGSIHYYFDGTESTRTSSDQLIDNQISDQTSHSFNVGYYGLAGDSGEFQGNVDDIRVSKSARYTTNFIPPASALPITGSTTTVYEPANSKVGEISLGGSPAWTGTPGITASQIAAGQYRATFATAYSNATDYVIQTSMNDYTPATTPVGIGVSRFTTHADFFVRRVSDGANIDTGSLAIDLFKK